MYNYISYLYGVKINNAKNLNELLQQFLLNAKEADIKEIKENWNLVDMKFPEGSDYEVDSVIWIANKMGNGLKCCLMEKNNGLKELFIGYSLDDVHDTYYISGYAIEIPEVSQCYKDRLATVLGNLALQAKTFISL